MPTNSSINQTVQKERKNEAIALRSMVPHLALEIGRLVLGEIDQRAKHLQVSNQRIHLGHDLEVAIEARDDSLGVALKKASGIAVGTGLDRSLAAFSICSSV